MILSQDLRAVDSESVKMFNLLPVDITILPSSPFESQNRKTKGYRQITRMGGGVVEERKNEMAKINKSLGRSSFSHTGEATCKYLDFRKFTKFHVC